MQADADFETALLGPVLDHRDCGDCSLCCTVLKVDSPDFKKSADQPCAHLAPRGCSIHAIRPNICRTWFCVWRRVAAMPEEARPDRSGLLVSLSFNREPRNCFEGVSITVRALPGSNAIANGMAARVLDAICDRLVPVWFSDGSEKMLMHPENDVAQHVIAGTAEPPNLREEVAAWRTHYGLFGQEKHR
jgi:hypothetical protein